MNTEHVAVIGLGRVGRQLAAALAAQNKLAVCVDTDPAVRAELRDRGWQALAQASAVFVDPHIDTVALCVPWASREALVRQALTQDRHVLVPMPFAPPEAAAELRALATERGLCLGALDAMAASGAVRAFLERLPELGEPLRVHLYRSEQPGRRAPWRLSAPQGPSVADLLLLLRCLGVTAEPERGLRWLNAQIDGADSAQIALQGPRGHAFLHQDLADAEATLRLTASGPRGALILNERGLFERPGHGAARRVLPEQIGALAFEPDLRGLLAAFEQAKAQAAPGHDGALTALAERALREAAAGQWGRSLEGAPGVYIHPTVQIDGPVQIGEGTRIWHFSKLRGPLEIGPGCNLGQNVVVEQGVRLGRNVKVQNNVSIYAGVILEDDVFCGPSMVFTNVSTPRSHHPRAGAYEQTIVGRGASIGANATVVCGHRLGRYSFVGAGAVVTRDVPDHALVYGNPARIHGYACVCGLRLDLGRGPQDAEAPTRAQCAGCGRRFRREGAVVSLEVEAHEDAAQAAQGVDEAAGRPE